MANLFYAPTANYVQTTLNGAINDSVDTITLSSTSNLLSPGYIVINRVDSTGTATPNAREVVFYTGVSGNNLTGCTRGADNSTARSHSSGAIVETMPTVGMWNSLATIVGTAVTGDGYLRPIASPASINRVESGFVRSSAVLASTATVTGLLNVSGASVVGIPLTPIWEIIGHLSGPSTMLRVPVPMPRAGTWEFANFITRTVASGVSALVDINKNGTSIFDAIGRPYIAAGGTFASTASIKTKTFDKGDIFTVDYDGQLGSITDILVELRSI